MAAGEPNDDNQQPAPLPAHERGWRHPSEVGYEAWMLSEPPLMLGRGLTATAGVLGIMIALAVLWTMVPTQAGRTAVVSVRSTLASSLESADDGAPSTTQSSSTGSFVVASTLLAPDETLASGTVAATTLPPPPMVTYKVAQTKTVEGGAVAIAVSGSSLLITTAYAVEADNTVQLRLTDGSTEVAQVLFVDQGSGLAVLATESLPEVLAFKVAEIAPGDELTLAGETDYSFTIGEDGTFTEEFTYDDSVSEGTPVMNQDGDLVGLCSNSNREHFVALGDLAVLQRALAGWAGLQASDVIMAINGVSIVDDETFVAALNGLMPGDSVELIVRFENGEQATIVVEFGATRPAGG